MEVDNINLGFVRLVRLQLFANKELSKLGKDKERVLRLFDLQIQRSNNANKSTST